VLTILPIVTRTCGRHPYWKYVIVGFHTPVVRNNNNSSTPRQAYTLLVVELFLLFLTTGVWNLPPPTFHRVRIIFLRKIITRQQVRIIYSNNKLGYDY